MNLTTDPRYDSMPLGELRQRLDPLLTLLQEPQDLLGGDRLQVSETGKGYLGEVGYNSLSPLEEGVQIVNHGNRPVYRNTPDILSFFATSTASDQVSRMIVNIRMILSR